MPRRPRIHLDGLPLHIVQRGHNREACFFCEEDYQSYLHWLGEALSRERVQLHAGKGERLDALRKDAIVEPDEAVGDPGLGLVEGIDEDKLAAAIGREILDQGRDTLTSAIDRGREAYQQARARENA